MAIRRLTSEFGTDLIAEGDIATGAVTTDKIAADAITSTKIATDAVGTTAIVAGAVGATEMGTTLDLSSKTVTVPAATVTAHVVPFDDTSVRSDMSILALHQAVGDNKAAFNLSDSLIDNFEDSTGIDSATTVSRHPTGKYWSTDGQLLSSNFDFTLGDSVYFHGNELVLNAVATFTQEVWVYVTAATIATTEVSGIWGSGYVDFSGTSVELNNGVTQEVHYYVANAASTAWTFGATTGVATPSINTWHHFAEVHSGNNIILYMDGAPIKTVATGGAIGYHMPSPSAHSHHLGIGCEGANRWCKALMNDWRISSTAKYSSNFAPVSTSAFVDDPSTTMLLLQSDTTDGTTVTKANSEISGYVGSILNAGTEVTHSARMNSTETAIASNLTKTAFSTGGTLIGTANVTSTARTKVSGVILYKDGVGTAQIGSGTEDLKIYFTCNGGTNWTEVAAADYTTITPVFSSGIKIVKLGETTCTSGSDVRYKAVFANQVSGGSGKETKLYGIGVNY